MGLVFVLFCPFSMVALDGIPSDCRPEVANLEVFEQEKTVCEDRRFEMICNRCGTIIDEDYDFFCEECFCCYAHCICGQDKLLQRIDEVGDVYAEDKRGCEDSFWVGGMTAK